MPAQAGIQCSSVYLQVDLLQCQKSMAAPREDLSRLVFEHTGVLLRGAMAMGFTQADAEELVQDTFVAFLQARDRFEGRSSVRTFLFGILYNKGAELSRKHQREERSEDIEKIFDAQFDGAGHWLADRPRGPDEEALDHELAEAISECAKGLSMDQKTAFFMKETEGLSSQEVCNTLGITDTNLRVLLYRARLRLRECLERTWERR